MSYHPHVYLTGKITRETDPLLRYFPPIPPNVHSGWLEDELKLKSPEWVIDPFGTSPFLSLELASRGYRVLTVSNNPITNFIIRIFARAPGELDFKAALSELSKIRRGDEWLDQHLKNLYTTECPQCNQPARAISYVWKKGEPFPDLCSYQCDNCHNDGEKPSDQYDFNKIDQIGSNKLHRARALQRVTDLNSNIEKDVDQILENYLTRPLYFITTLINKIEGSSITQDRKELLQALILSVCDQGNTLWGYPSVRNRPKQLVTPPSFREFNLWSALESSIEFWIGQSAPVDLVNYPQIPGEKGGICLYSNRLKSIGSLPEEISLRAAICIFPRPNQAYWTLSALWSGWLWGKQAAAPMANVFGRKRYDWNWLDNALSSTLLHLNKLLPPQTPVFSMLSEMDPGFIVASIHAASTSGFKLEGAAQNEDDQILQIWWKNGTYSRPIDQNIPLSIQNAIVNYLSQVGEPVSYLRLFTNTLLETTENKLLNLYRSKNNLTLLKLFQTDFDKGVTSDRRISRFPSENTNLENSSIALKNPSEIMSLSDLVEMEIVNFLNHNPLKEYEIIEKHIYGKFPGLLTPRRELIHICLDSYAEEVTALPGFPGKWQLHSRETPNTRKVDIQEIVNILTHLGTEAGFKVTDHNPLIWMNSMGEVEYIFYIMASSIISRHVFSSAKDARQSLIVLPGSRSKLLSYKLQNDYNLSRLVDQGNWKFLKFRHIRTLSHKQIQSPKAWLDLINLDPPAWEDAVQLTIFPDDSG